LESPPALVAAGASRPPARAGANFLVVPGHIRLWHTNRDALERVRAELEQKAGAGLYDARPDQRVATFADVLAAAMTFPVGVTDQEAAKQQVREQFQRYYEETWIHQPLKSLSNIPPIDATGHGLLRKKLLGVVQFLADCADMSGHPYDFDRLRRKLGLLPGE